MSSYRIKQIGYRIDRIYGCPPRDPLNRYCLFVISTDVTVRARWRQQSRFHPIKYYGHTKIKGMDLDRISSRHKLSSCYIVSENILSQVENFSNV